MNKKDCSSLFILIRYQEIIDRINHEKLNNGRCAIKCNRCIADSLLKVLERNL